MTIDSSAMQDFTLTKPDFGKSPLAFFQEVKSELLKVSWPSWPTVIRLTGVVLGVSIVVGLYLGGLDFIFTKLVQVLLRK